MEAIAICLPNGEKFCKVVRLYHYLPPRVNKRVRTCLSCPRPAPVHYYLFDNGEVYTVKKVMEETLQRSCRPLTLGHPCGYWFTLRNFRLSASVTADLLLPSPEMYTAFSFSHRGQSGNPDAEGRFSDLVKSWFSKPRSTKEMMRGTINEEISSLFSLRLDR